LKQKLVNRELELCFSRGVGHPNDSPAKSCSYTDGDVARASEIKRISRVVKEFRRLVEFCDRVYLNDYPERDIGQVEVVLGFRMQTVWFLLLNRVKQTPWR
jgi:hypothetical protein